MRIICDVGTSRFESQNIGLLYTALSRATTIGTAESNRKESAIFFTQSLDRNRLDRLTTKADNTEYESIKQRNAWIHLMNKNINNKEMNISDKKINQTIEWASKTILTINDIENIICK
jgi:hypothetical protein